jgi:hypothetical protein
MPPIDLLALLLLATASAVVLNRLLHRREQAEYRRLAVQHRMHYSPADPLRLTPRVAARLPIPGAAAVRVIDLLYRTDEQTHYYIFTVEYTVGVYGPKRRVRRAAQFVESKTDGKAPIVIRLGAADVSLVEQYHELIGPV